MVLQIKVQLDRLRRLTLPNFDWLGHVVHEHEEVVVGIAAGDPDRAAAAMRRHFDSLKRVLGELGAMNPDYFVGAVDEFAP